MTSPARLSSARSYQARVRAQRRAEGLCVDCGVEAPTYYCDGCHAARLAYQRDWYQRRRTA